MVDRRGALDRTTVFSLAAVAVTLFIYLMIAPAYLLVRIEQIEDRMARDRAAITEAAERVREVDKRVEQLTHPQVMQDRTIDYILRRGEFKE